MCFIVRAVGLDESMQAMMRQCVACGDADQFKWTAINAQVGLCECSFLQEGDAVKRTWRGAIATMRAMQTCVTDADPAIL
jgi:hypothetical protein